MAHQLARAGEAVLLALARSPAGRMFAGRLLAHMSFAIPVRRLRETETLLAFPHPRPGYPVHILLVPKKALGSLADLTPADTPFLADLFATVQSLVAELGLEENGYRLIANGGRYQDVPHLHFHLVSGLPQAEASP
ncbi:MAG: HIT domain-containing protein [Chloroflexi bacterium]|nr:HIT domain-containing protein [Chloroflexota bacterium]MCI0574614.1 HIT domain-containing protein [Chloroflexota bacterium]MCI0644034.1 HIT domain-containing protein [Chloroflexota bacterium]MCI0731708.1 HIT domain-containing protein [Chloroflexota bacterium]